jgi:hypothetical protein
MLDELDENMGFKEDEYPCGASGPPPKLSNTGQADEAEPTREMWWFWNE